MATTIKPWADTPFKLIPTPGESDDVNTLSAIVWVAREMACAHNGMLRGLNSVYQQCIFVHEAKDIEDLLLYTKFWCDWIDEHHEGEETIFFPQVEIVTGVEGLMAKNVAQHHAFLPGLQKLKKYTSETKAGNYTGEELRRVVDEFGAMLTRHLTEEIATLLDLEAYDAKALKVAYVEFDEAMRQGEKVRAVSILNSLANKGYRAFFTRLSWEHRMLTSREQMIGHQCRFSFGISYIIGLSGHIKEFGDSHPQRLGGRSEH